VKKNTSNTIITVVGFDIVIMKIQNLVLALGLAGLGVVQQISSAQALSYTWSFVTDSGSTGGAGNTVSGTISGLNIGANNGNGLTISTSTTPNGQLENTALLIDMRYRISFSLLGLQAFMYLMRVKYAV